MSRLVGQDGDGTVDRGGRLRPGHQQPDSGRPSGIVAQGEGVTGYVADLWSIDAAALPDGLTVVLLGTGLSMVDVALRLHRVKPDLRMIAISRRGLLPRVQLAEGPTPAEVALPEGASPVRLLGHLKRSARGRDWRAMVDGARTHVHDIWRGWTLAERRRFLRHARPWWDVHRHRMAPPVASKLTALVEADTLTVAAGLIRLC